MSKLKIAVSVICFLGWAVWISGVFGNRGVIQAYRLWKVREELKARVQSLDNEKRRLTRNLDAIETDPLVQERVIRDTIGFVRDGELVIEFQ